MKHKTINPLEMLILSLSHAHAFYALLQKKSRIKYMALRNNHHIKNNALAKPSK